MMVSLSAVSILVAVSCRVDLKGLLTFYKYAEEEVVVKHNELICGFFMHG